MPPIATSKKIEPFAEQWNALALQAGTPFVTHEWLSAWELAYGEGSCEWVKLLEGDGSLRAGACVVRPAAGVLASTTNAHSPDWEILARDAAAREELAGRLLAARPGRVRLLGMREELGGVEPLRRALAAAGYRTAQASGPLCPWLDLPASFEELEAEIKGSLRSQVRRRRRMLEREGRLEFRIGGEGPRLERDLEEFLRIEASGWKGRDGTAILSRPETARLYRDFAYGAAERGWLRLYFLELDGRTLAADYGIAFADTAYFVKTGFDEDHGRLSPGLVLRAEVLRSSIEEGLTGYDFLGDPDPYKTRWTSALRPRVQLWGYRGAAVGGYVYRKRLRPFLKDARDRLAAVRARVASARKSDR